MLWCFNTAARVRVFWIERFECDGFTSDLVQLGGEEERKRILLFFITQVGVYHHGPVLRLHFQVSSKGVIWWGGEEQEGMTKRKKKQLINIRNILILY